MFFAALNPTGPCFDPAQADKCKGKAFPQYMLNKTTADYVEVLFTGREYWGICQPHVDGEKSDMGHAIFFANGGYKQPGCEKLDSGGKFERYQNKALPSVTRCIARAEAHNQ